MSEGYYLSEKTKLLKGFDRASGWFRPYMVDQYSEEAFDEVIAAARKEYENLIPQIPYIGGSKVHMTSDLLESVMMLAYLRAFHAHGMTVEESREIIFQSLKTRINQYPKFIVKILGRMTFTRFYLRNLQAQAKESKKREYPAGFVFDLILGDGNEFDWGLDFSECGICKFYQAQNASEFLRLVCPIDYVLSDAFGYGLVRTQTLAEGADRWNPRMKRGRRTEWRLADGDRLSSSAA